MNFSGINTSFLYQITITSETLNPHTLYVEYLEGVWSQRNA